MDWLPVIRDAIIAVAAGAGIIIPLLIYHSKKGEAFRTRFYEFEKGALERLGRIDGHLESINGSVARHEQEIRDLRNKE